MSDKNQTQKNSAAYATIYETKDVIVATVTTSILGVLSLTETNVTDQTKRNIQSQVNGNVTTQLDSLVTRLQKILD